MTKREAQKRHAIRRAGERYGGRLRRGEYDEICARIQSGTDVQILGRQSLRVSYYAVWWRDRPMLAVYDHKRGSVATFLPLGDDACPRNVRTGGFD